MTVPLDRIPELVTAMDHEGLNRLLIGAAIDGQGETAEAILRRTMNTLTDQHVRAFWLDEPCDCGEHEPSLALWTVYDHPRDKPDRFVARKFLVTSKGPRTTLEVITAGTLGEIRSVMERMGLTLLPRESFDDPVIVESWV